MRLILVRHGQTDWNKEYRIQGQADLPLNEFGRAQAKAIAETLKDEPVEAIYSSPLNRTLETARAIDEFHHIGITRIDALKELSVGDLDGIYYPDIETTSPDFFRIWSTDPASARWPGGETLPELQSRVWGAIQEIIAKSHEKSVVVTSHLFAILAIRCKALDLNLSNFRNFNLSVGGISTLEFAGDRSRLVSFNETCHLGALC